uniref:Ubiquitin-like protease family profile domain-containing protein n=1 Tax=Oryza rufipogon TaxID=4529 RepID=A0A0E0QRJ8_ORYRU
MFNLFEITSRSLREESNRNSQKHRMASDRTSSDDECSSNSKSDNKVADSDYANSISEEEETSDSDKYITKKDLVSTLKDLDRSKGKELGQTNQCAIPLSFVKWIASHTDVSCSDIVVNGRSIPINPNTTNFILGIPNGGLEIKNDNDAGKHFFHQHFGSTKPLISFFGTKLLSDKGVNKLSEDDVLRCFMVVALSTFLCPNSDTHPSPKYLEPLSDIKSSSKWNWSKFVYEWLMTYIAKFQKESKSKEQTSKTLGGCGHLLAINYLDFKDFGIRNIPIGPPPRISVWKGGMIKEYSKIDECKTGDFGKRPLIDDISTVCKWFTREHSDTTYGKNAQLAAKVLDCVYMSKASLFTQKDTTTTREEKSGEEKSKGGSKQGGNNVAHNGNAPPLEQNHPNNTDVCSQLPKTPQTKSTAEHKTKSNINNTSTSKGAPPTDKKASSKDFVCSQQSNNSVASRTRAKRLHSASPLSVVSISPSKKNSSDQKIRKAVRKQPLKATEPINTQPDREESNKDALFVEPICTIPAKKEEVQPTKNLESSSTEFVIDIEGPYDAEDITGHTTDKTKFILVNYSNSSEEHNSQDPTQDESDNIPNKSTNQPKFECLHHFDDKSKTNKSASLGHFLSQTTSGTNIMDIEHSSMQVTQGESYMHTPKTCINNKDGVQHLSANFIANMGNRRLEGQHCDENEYQDDFAEFLYEEEPSDNIDMSSQSSPDIGMNSPRIAQMREPNQHAQIEERQYSMIRIIDSLNASANCSGTRHNLYRPKRIVHPILMDNVKVTWSSLSKSLSPRGVVDTYVLNAYAKKIANDQNNKENEYRNFYFFHRTSLIFPCLYDNHWFVFTVDIKGHHFVFLDSIYDENNKYHKKIQGLLIPGFIAMWEEFSYVEKNFSKFDIQYPPITRQNNGSQEEAKMLARSFNPTKHGKYARQQ